MEDRSYLCIDLKSFYASVECIDRGLDPMEARLVVADPSRTEKTICLAVSPALKALGVRNRCRVFEIPAGIDYITASPRMARYIERSADVYSVYLRYIAPEDIHVYSIDEAFMDVTPYLELYGTSARELGERIRADVAKTTGIPAACGLGTNLYLAKVALDITAKKSEDFFGELTEESYRQTLWHHRPLTDFWRIGERIAARLERMGIHDMAELALAPPEMLYREFGIDAEIMIDHAWGAEPVRMEHIKAYRGKTSSLSTAQVLARGYSFDEARTLVREMAESLALELVDKGKLAAGVHVHVGYEMTAEQRAFARSSGTRAAWYKATSFDGGTRHFPAPTAARPEIVEAALEVYDERISRSAPIKRIGLTVGDLTDADASGVQLSFADLDAGRDEDRKRQKAVLAVKRKFGKNALLKGTDLLPEATQRERNEQIGGHKSG